MLESRGEYQARARAAGMSVSPGEDLARFRYHTGATPTPLAEDEPCPVLFRDLGLATGAFLRGEIKRLAGPYTPVTYLRTARYREPYEDHEAIGRLVVLRPQALAPWRAGTPEVFIARATRGAGEAAVAYVPGGHDLEAVERAARGMRSADELREALGGLAYDQACDEARARLEALAREIDETERVAAPLRAALQSSEPVLRRRAQSLMERAGLDEDDVCAAWHHLPRARRVEIRSALDALAPAASGLLRRLR